MTHKTQGTKRRNEEMHRKKYPLVFFWVGLDENFSAKAF